MTTKNSNPIIWQMFFWALVSFGSDGSASTAVQPNMRAVMACFATSLSGWLDENWMQIVYQLIDTVAGLAWSFGITFMILWIMNKIPGLSLHVNIEVERNGLDQGEHGFSCYEHVEDVRTIKGSTEQIGPQVTHQNGHSNLAFQIEQSRM